MKRGLHIHELVGRHLSPVAAIGFGAFLFLLGGPEGHAQLWQARKELTAAEFQKEFDRLGRGGYRLVDVNGYTLGGTVRFAALWEKKAGPPWIARMGLTLRAITYQVHKLMGEGYRLVRVSGYSMDGRPHYAAIWEKGGTIPAHSFHLTHKTFLSLNEHNRKKSFQLVRVSGYSVRGKAYYAGLWQLKKGGSSWFSHHRITPEAYQEVFTRQGRDGYRLVHINGYSVRGKVYYAAIWNKIPGPPWVARHGMSSSAYPKQSFKFFKLGFNLKQVSGYVANGEFQYAAIWEK